MKTIKNASQKPQRYFGLHMVEGVAEYREPGQDPYRILINEDAIKNMDQTFEGLPVYVHHVDEVDLSNIQTEADGFVIRSFYNKSDGKHWAEFIIVSDKGHEAIKIKHWKLSNAYIPKDVVGGGQWHGVDYQKEIKSGVYEHLAIVPNPRYAESIILTPEEFKSYNNEKEIELTRLANSKEEKTMLSFFKKAKVENSVDLESMSVTLPKSKVDKTITQLVNEADAILANGYMCNGDERVKVGDKEMSVNELVTKHIEMTADTDPAKENAGDEEAKKKALELAAHEEEEMTAAKKNEDEEDTAMENEEDPEAEEKKKKDEEKKKNALANFNKLKNAQSQASKKVVKIELASEKLARGVSRYGSTK